MFWLLWVIIVGLIAGWLAGKIMGTGGYGPVIDILLGIAGATSADSCCVCSAYTLPAA